jgi:hypothetical protein
MFWQNLKFMALKKLLRKSFNSSELKKDQKTKNLLYLSQNSKTLTNILKAIFIDLFPSFQLAQHQRYLWEVRAVKHV